MKNDKGQNVPLRQVQTMRRNTDRLLELVNQLLDLSKLDSGKMKLQVIKGDVIQLLKMLAARIYGRKKTGTLLLPFSGANIHCIF